MIDPKTVYLAMPCGDGRNMCETTASLIRVAGRFAAFSFPAECSHVSLVRNYVAEGFIRSELEWLVSVDSDIYFTPQDWDFLMEPANNDWERAGEPQPSRTEISTIVSVDNAEQRRFNRANVPADLLVCAQYAFKNEGLEPVKLGMGFVRIHRSVFDTLANLKHAQSEEHARLTDLIGELEEKRNAALKSDSVERVAELEHIIAVVRTNLPDRGGEPRCWQLMSRGRLISDFYPSGPLVNHLVPTAEWKGEDHGFWTLCMIAGLIPRIERRTRLVHIGRKAYCYEPDSGGAQ